jgi:hypothetical protein
MGIETYISAWNGFSIEKARIRNGGSGGKLLMYDFELVAGESSINVSFPSAASLIEFCEKHNVDYVDERKEKKAVK